MKAIKMETDRFGLHALEHFREYLREFLSVQLLHRESPRLILLRLRDFLHSRQIKG